MRRPSDEILFTSVRSDEPPLRSRFLWWFRKAFLLFRRILFLAFPPFSRRLSVKRAGQGWYSPKHLTGLYTQFSQLQNREFPGKSAHLASTMIAGSESISFRFQCQSELVKARSQKRLKMGITLWHLYPSPMAMASVGGCGDGIVYVLSFDSKICKSPTRSGRKRKTRNFMYFQRNAFWHLAMMAQFHPRCFQLLKSRTRKR